MPLNDKALDYLESQIPELAQAAIRQAYWAALATGNSVLISDQGFLYEVFPDGSRRQGRAITPPTPVTIGTKFNCS